MMVPELFSIAELIAATGGRAHNLTAKTVSAISIDSRTLAKDALFVAIKGDRFDGHDFVDMAIKNGAAAALVSEQRVAQFSDLPVIGVHETLIALGHIAKRARQRSRATIVAVTGSAGKTSTKIGVDLVLSAAGETHSSIKSYNNHWGVPLMLAGMKRSAKFGVFEIGMNHAGEITPLAKMVSPHIALITNIGLAHIGNFENIEGISAAKGEIFSGLVAGGTAIINADHNQLALLKNIAKESGVGKVMTYGFSPVADVQIAGVRYSSLGSSALVTIKGQQVELKIKAHGEHMLANAVAALCVGQVCGVPIDVSLLALSKFEVPGGRGTLISLGPKANPVQLIDESYNANPDSIAAALAVFSRQKTTVGRKILVLGDMYELGDHSARLHAGLRQIIETAEPDIVYFVGAHMLALANDLDENIEVGGAVTKVEEIIDPVLNKLAFGDLIMVKGSNGVGLGRLILAIRNRFAGGG